MSNIRLEYIDAMRGFAMLLVVMGHVEIFGFHLLNTPLLRVISTFHVPLFFFLSGLLAYPICQDWKWNAMILLTHKIRQLLFPTLFFGVLYAVLCRGTSLQAFLTHPYKMGYWFTIALFQMFVILYLINNLCYKINERKQTVDHRWMVLLIGFSVILYIVKIPLMHNPILFNIANIGSLHCLCLYFQFFTFGLIFAHFKSFFSYINNKYINGLCVVLFITLVYSRHELIGDRETTSIDIWKLIGTAIDTCCGYLGIVIIYQLFYWSRTYISTSKRMGLYLQTIGRRTLDVYLLHWFFLSAVRWISRDLPLTENLYIEFISCLLATLLITSCCLLISHILRSRNCIAYWLLGAKSHKPKEATLK